MSKLNDFIKALELISKHGEYDHSLIGPLGEAYAEEVLGMIKAPPGEKGFDGYLADRKVQVKAKKPRKEKPLSQLYVSINHKNHGIADDILVVYFDYQSGKWDHIGPVAISEIRYSDNKTHKRYSLSNIFTEYKKNCLN